MRQPFSPNFEGNCKISPTAKFLQYHSLATAARIENSDCWEEEVVDTFKGSDGGGKRIVKMETLREKSEIEIPPETKI